MIVFSHSLMGQAWALHTGDMDLLCGTHRPATCLHAATAAASSISMAAGKEMQHHTKGLSNEDELLRVTRLQLRPPFPPPDPSLLPDYILASPPIWAWKGAPLLDSL